MYSPFDDEAAHYDDQFSQRVIGRWLRERTWSRMAAMFEPGQTVLELGCGTGEDAIWLAQHGIRVIATDASQAMLNITQEKADRHSLSNAIQVKTLDLNNLPSWTLMADGVISNFGAVNCTNDWQGLADFIRQQLKPGGRVGLGIMPPFCLWESAWHALHLDFKTATRRWNRQTKTLLPTGSELMVYYPTIQQISRAFSPDFKRDYLMGLGVSLPPSDVYPVIERHPRLSRFLMRLEQRLGPFLPAIADHYWIELSLLH